MTNLKSVCVLAERGGCLHGGRFPRNCQCALVHYLGEETARSSTEHRGLRNEEGEREREGRRKYSLRKEQRKRGHLLMKTEARRNLLLQIFYQVLACFTRIGF